MGDSNEIRLDQSKEEGSEETHLVDGEGESVEFGNSLTHRFHSVRALEILRETVRVLRFNASSFMLIAALLICPVSAVFMSNVLVSQSLVKRLTVKLLLVAKSSGLPLSPVVKQSCHRFTETFVSWTMCFPLFLTVSLLSKTAVVYSVDCTYSRKSVDFSMLLVVVKKIWRRVVLTYLLASMVIVGCLTLFCFIYIAVCSAFSVIGFSSELNIYAAIVIGLVFSVVFGNAIIVCEVSTVISVLEDVSGPQALLRSWVLVKEQIQVGLAIFLGSTIGMASIEGLYDHRVKTISYGDGSSRIWEGPLLMVMYSFVALISMMTTVVFYYSCRYYSTEASDDQSQSILETITISPELEVKH